MSARVYVSGPMSLGDRVANVQAAIDTGNWFVDRGVASLVPHYSMHPQARPAEPGTAQYERVIVADLAWVEAADAVLLLSGKSSGAEREVAHARAHGIPVFTDRVEALAYCLGLKALRIYVARWGSGSGPVPSRHGERKTISGAPGHERGLGGAHAAAEQARGPVAAGAGEPPRTGVAYTPGRYTKHIGRRPAARSLGLGKV